MIASPTTAPRPMTRLNTPAGRPERLRMSASAQPQPGTRSAGLNTTQLPQASAGAIFHAGTPIGEFQGGITPTPPHRPAPTPPPPPRRTGGDDPPPGAHPPPPTNSYHRPRRPP